jgi:hypothetical protein
MGFNDGGGAFLPLPVLLAVAGYAYSTWNQIASEHRHGQLERVNEQVSALHHFCLRYGWGRVHFARRTFPQTLTLRAKCRSRSFTARC